jgi:phosphoglycerate dehydrogenase-like enzyme
MGLGKLGAQSARVGLAFSMRVVAWSENLTDARAAECGVQRVSKSALLAESDIISIHLVLGDRTRGLVGAAEFAQMKPEALLVNTSRGPIVDEAALIAALGSGQIAGAGIDVFDIEPLPADHGLRRLDNVVLTGHLGYSTREAFDTMYPQCLECVNAWLAGAPVRVINAG